MNHPHQPTQDDAAAAAAGSNDKKGSKPAAAKGGKDAKGAKGGGVPSELGPEVPEGHKLVADPLLAPTHLVLLEVGHRGSRD